MAASTVRRHETRALLRAHLAAASKYRHRTGTCPVCRHLQRLATEYEPVTAAVVTGVPSAGGTAPAVPPAAWAQPPDAAPETPGHTEAHPTPDGDAGARPSTGPDPTTDPGTDRGTSTDTDTEKKPAPGTVSCGTAEPERAAVASVREAATAARVPAPRTAAGEPRTAVGTGASAAGAETPPGAVAEPR
jgi:hypothetical protein